MTLSIMGKYCNLTNHEVPVNEHEICYLNVFDPALLKLDSMDLHKIKHRHELDSNASERTVLHDVNYM